MTCPDCQAALVVLDSRIDNGEGYVRRRRGCPRCPYRVTTYEHQFAAKFTASTMRTELASLRKTLASALDKLGEMEDALSKETTYHSDAQVQARLQGAFRLGQKSA